MNTEPESKRGKLRLVASPDGASDSVSLMASKFVPGISVIAPPLAGALGMRTRTFLAIQLAASALWSAAGLALGMAFQAQIGLGLRTLREWGSSALLLLMVPAAAWMAWRVGRSLLTARWLAATGVGGRSC